MPHRTFKHWRLLCRIWCTNPNFFAYLTLAGAVLTAQSAHATAFCKSALSSSSSFQVVINQDQLDDVIILRARSYYMNTLIRLPPGKSAVTIRG